MAQLLLLIICSGLNVDSTRIMKETYAGSERRQYPRVEEGVLISYETLKSPQVKTSWARNISGGGFCFDVAEPLSRDDVLQLVIAKVVDDGARSTTMAIQAKVIWVGELGKGKYRVGSQFTEIDEMHRAEIIENVEQKLKG